MLNKLLLAASAYFVYMQWKKSQSPALPAPAPVPDAPTATTSAANNKARRAKMKAASLSPRTLRAIPKGLKLRRF
jgi:hypothetical protein